VTALRTMPVELLLEGRLAVCLGACDEVAYKVDRLVGAGAIVHVIEAGAVAPSILAHESAGTVTVERREPAEPDAAGAVIVFVSPRHEALGARLAAAARSEGRLVCTLDRPHAATFVNPAVAGSGPLRLSIASGGRSPALVRKVREGLEKALASPRLAAFVERVAAIRSAAAPADRARTGRESVEGFAVDLVVQYPAWFQPAPADEGEPRDGGSGTAGTGAGPGAGPRAGRGEAT
jgi:precorrin-2 dehydrogenase/sirohydrochlorin ferrochelatase